ncbi:NADH:flavin oxidoreductase [Acidaminobacter sp. JC074]|uniref:NADH:flavin oxidoreductase n=1 Tax=Acidaminobacter sp. JC074 TaxID=2530199 RepID=UPI001F0ED738|nr:NADH:flavin oxidoreductase [Acidaminobacter sp. JC074]
MKFEELQVSSEIELGKLTIKNRIVRSATHSMLGNLDGSISEDELKMFKDLAENEVGLIIAGQFFVSGEATAGPGSNELTHDRHIESASKIMELVKPFDTKVVAQLNHAGAHAYSQTPYGASEMDLGDGRKARSITIEEIKRVKSEFIDAALRAQKSGFHGIQLHAAHSYLLCEFLKPSINKRQDQYGGDSENRFRLIKEIIEGIQEACGDNYPIFIKIDTNDLQEQETYNDDLENMMSEFRSMGIEAVEFSGSEFSGKKFADHNYFLDRAIEISKDKGIKTIVVGGVRHFNDMEAILSAGMDMVSICRPFICEPDFITRLIKGQEKSSCVTCRKCPQAGRDRCILRVKK